MSVGAEKSLLARFDADERYSAVMPGLRREELPHVVRHVDLLGHAGTVLYSHLTADTADLEICEQIDYFSGIGQDFEWKAFSHDSPPDLVDRLSTHGFSIDEPEAIMVLDLQSAEVIPRGSAEIRRVMTRAELHQVAHVKQLVYGDGFADQSDQLGFELENAPDFLSVYLAYVDDVPVATAWIRFPKGSAFASLWGGSTVPQLRNRGLYTALVAARLDEARQRGFRYVTVDARTTSRPILEKRGFRLLTYATACTWHE